MEDAGERLLIMRLDRRKPRNLLLTALYRLSRLLGALPARTRLRLFAELEWIFDRLALETSFVVFTPDQHPARRAALAFLLKHIGPSDRVLDFGAKLGDLSALIAPHCREVVGVELDETFVREAARRHASGNLLFLQGDGRHYLEREAAAFDVVLFSHVIEHLEAPGEVLSSTGRRSRLVYVEVPDFQRSHLNEYRAATGSSLIYSDQDHVWEFDRSELRALIEESGLEVFEEEARFGVIRAWCRPRA